MGIFDKLFDNELILAQKTLLKKLDEIENKYNNNSFYIYKDDLIMGIKHKQQAIKILEISKGFPGNIDEFFHGSINQMSGNDLESGKYHVYRGMLNIIGQDILDMFDKSLDFMWELKAKGMPSIEFVKEQKNVIRKNISKVG